MDFDDMIFSIGSIFIFGSWVCEADDKDNLHGHLIKALEAHKDLTLSMKVTKDLEKLTVSEPTQAPITINPDLTSESYSSQSLIRVLSKTNQDLSQSDSGMQHQLYKRSVRIYFRFLPRN
jgi:hypothetical protein